MPSRQTRSGIVGGVLCDRLAAQEREADRQLVTDDHPHRVGAPGVLDKDLERNLLVEVQERGRLDIDGQGNRLLAERQPVGWDDEVIAPRGRFGGGLARVPGPAGTWAGGKGF